MNRPLAPALALSLMFALSVACKPSQTASDTDTEPNTEAKIEAAISALEIQGGGVLSLAEAMQKIGLQGLSVAVIENYELSWTRTWGVRSVDTKQMVDTETVFSTASISKAITATLFAMLAEKGMIDLDVPVANYLKRWKLPDNEHTRSVGITLRHLLTHTAGTTQHGYDDFYVGDELPTLVDVLDGGALSQTQRIEVDFTPGTRSRYSGGGFVIAQMAVEDHLGESLADLAEEYLFKPLEMKRTTMRQPGEPGFPDNAAMAHDSRGKVVSAGLPICPQTAPSGMWSTPSNMAILLLEVQRALRGDETRVITPTVARQVTTEHKDGFGLGWSVFSNWSNRWFSHGGANTGTGGYIVATMQDGNGVAFFGNGPNSIREPILQAFFLSIIKAHGWE